MSWAVHLMFRLIGVTWHSSYASAAFIKKLMTRRQWWKNANKVASADKTSRKPFNRCLKQRATLWFQQPTTLPKGKAFLNSHFKLYCLPKLTLVVSMQINPPSLSEMFIPCKHLLKAQKMLGVLTWLPTSSLISSISM